MSKMKLYTGFFIAMMFTAPLIADCLNGNFHPLVTTISPGDGPYDVEVSLEENSNLCCTPVGDGSALSCTDGTEWINLPNYN